MSERPTTDLIDDVAPGDVVTLPRAADRAPAKVVHKEATDAGFLVTFEADGGATYQLDLEAGTPVERTLESKWESVQSPTVNARD
jgi:hypothetical protein